MGDLIQFPKEVEEECDHKDYYGSTIIEGSIPTRPPICILCDKEFPELRDNDGTNS